MAQGDIYYFGKIGKEEYNTSNKEYTLEPSSTCLEERIILMGQQIGMSQSIKKGDNLNEYIETIGEVIVKYKYINGGEDLEIDWEYKAVEDKEENSGVGEGQSTSTNTSDDLNWIPEIMQLDGSTKAEQYLAYRINNLNSRISNKDLKWTQEKIDQIWITSELIYDSYGIQVDPRLLLSIIFQEGTGSFNTSATNLAADGQHGVEADFAVDLMKANKLIFGKILGYAYYGNEFNQVVSANNDKAGISGTGNFFQYANWNTPIIDMDRGTVRYGVYAGHGAWHEGVSGIYENLSYIGASGDYSGYLSSVDKNSILQITGDISLPNVGFSTSQTAQDYKGNPNGKYIIQARKIQ